jgi:ribonuclease III
MKRLFDKLHEALGYHFKDVILLEMALTHRSRAAINNERLEFLGDAILSFFVAEHLFHQYPQLTEGGLSRLRANLVNGEMLAELAKELTISDYLRLGVGEMKSGGLGRKSILSNVMEAIIGAVYLDGGISDCRECVLRWFASRFDMLTSQGVMKDPKTRLQEYLQAKKMSLPQYIVLDVEGREHNQLFKVQCRISGLTEKVQGTGSSRRRAEQSAAENFLQLLGRDS